MHAQRMAGLTGCCCFIYLHYFGRSILSMAVIAPATFRFLRSLHKNNNREWFTRNRAAYEQALENMIDFSGDLLQMMQVHDKLEPMSAKQSLFLIYRDTRFSTDKTPYKSYWAGHFKRVKPHLRGGYYYQVGPGHTMLAAGFFAPNPSDLLRIRQDIDYNYKDWQRILSQKKFRQMFGPLKGSGVQTVPRGFDRNHPALDLLRHKQFYAEHRFTDEEALQPGFSKKLNEAFKAVRPWFDYMSEVLTTDANGISLV